jgi:hypothetical protein
MSHRITNALAAEGGSPITPNPHRHRQSASPHLCQVEVSEFVVRLFDLLDQNDSGELDFVEAFPPP